MRWLKPQAVVRGISIAQKSFPRFLGTEAWNQKENLTTSFIHFWKDMAQAALYIGLPAVQNQEASRAALERGSALELIYLCNRFSWLLRNTLGVVSISSTVAITSWKLWTANIFFPTWKKKKRRELQGSSVCLPIQQSVHGIVCLYGLGRNRPSNNKEPKR